MSEIYYYYCSANTFESLMQSQSLWLTDLTQSNDDEEVKRTFEILWSEIKEILQNRNLDRSLFEGQMKVLDSTLQLQLISDIPYGCCFCAEDDLVHMWTEYGDDGKGICIGFDLTWFGILKQRPITSSIINNAIGYCDVIYDLPEIANQFAELFYNEIMKCENTTWLDLLSTLKHYSGFIKNKTFRDEKETRIVYYPDDLIKSPFKGLSDLIEQPKKHYCLQWKDDNSSAMRSIMLGRYCKLMDEDVKKLIQKTGIKENISITHSQCSYRERIN